MKRPVLLDSSVKRAFIIMYLMYALWGAAAFFYGIQTINLVAGNVIDDVWALIVCLISTLAATSAGVGRDKFEAYVTAIWIGFVLIYPCTLIYRVFVLGDLAAFAAIFLGIGYLVIPSWRFFFLIRRVRASVTIAEKETDQ